MPPRWESSAQCTSCAWPTTPSTRTRSAKPANASSYGAHGTPQVAEFLSLEISALLGISPASGACLIGEVLNCVYRHPVMWDSVQAGTVRWHRASEVIDLVNAAGLPLDAAQWVDRRIAPLLATLPRARALRKLKGLVVIAAPELAREREERAKADRHVAIWTPLLGSDGCCEIAGRLDVHDAVTLDATLAKIADTLAALGDEASLDIRRATALGILADAALVGRVDKHGPLSRETWIELLGHGRNTIRPILDLNAIAPVDAYEIPDRIRNAVLLRSPVDTFPYGGQLAHRCDLDHAEPYHHSSPRPPGQTRIENLSPLSRKAHRAKTARRWKVTPYDGGWLEWVSPAGYRYATGPYGTLREITAA